MKKSYTSFEEIDQQLEILKLEREIQIKKIGLGIENISSAITPGNLAKSGIMNLASTVQGSSGFKSALVTLFIRFIVKQLKRKKSS